MTGSDGVDEAVLPPPPELTTGADPIGAAPAPRRSGKRRVWLAVAVIGIVVALVGVLVVPRLVGGSGDDLAWDPRVADLIGFVEEERGLTFDHAVPIDFLSQHAFEAELVASEEDLTAEDRREFAATEAALAAQGLIPRGTDLFDQINTVNGEGTLAFYDAERERVFLPDAPLTPMVRSVLIHELTHALQDQRFGLDDLASDDLTDDEASAYRALVEGDATRIENAYVAAMGPEDTATYREELKAAIVDVGADFVDVPAFLQVLFEAPYALGEPMTAALAIEDPTGIDRAFTERPTSEEHLLDPFTFLDGEEPIEVPTPRLGAGETEVDAGDYGTIGWYLLLASQLDARTALEAAEGWGGDSYVISRSDHGTCVRAAFRGDDVFQTQQMEVALGRWVREMPAGAHHLLRTADTVTLRSCDSSAAIPDGAVPRQALALPLLRTMLVVQATGVEWPTNVARCAATRTLDALSPEGVEDLTTRGFTRSVNDEITEAIAGQLEACST